MNHPDPSAPDEPLSSRVRTATRLEHEAAERTALMARLVAGTLPRAAFVDYTVQLHFLYEALEDTVAAVRGHGTEAARQVQPLLDPALDRRAALAADLHDLIGPRWTSVARPAPATAAYAEHLRALADAWPGLVLAHHYTRYLGDLSGGRAIGQIAARTYGLGPGTGLSFYDFAGVPHPKTYKDAYRARLDALPWDRATQDLMLAEVARAYTFNQKLIEGVDHVA